MKKFVDKLIYDSKSDPLLDILILSFFCITKKTQNYKALEIEQWLQNAVIIIIIFLL